VHHHDVSILIAIARGDGWCLGVWPRLNTSMMRILPPQQGQGGSSVPSAASPVLLASAEMLGAGAPSSSRAVAIGLGGKGLLGSLFPHQPLPRIEQFEKRGHAVPPSLSGTTHGPWH
jgi:hypothetical protein